MDTPLSPLLESERLHTDESLVTERNKTNESIIDAKLKAEKKPINW